jgi:hypothetical protein
MNKLQLIEDEIKSRIIRQDGEIRVARLLSEYEKAYQKLRKATP